MNTVPITYEAGSTPGPAGRSEKNKNFRPYWGLKRFNQSFAMEQNTYLKKTRNNIFSHTVSHRTTQPSEIVCKTRRTAFFANSKKHQLFSCGVTIFKTRSIQSRRATTTITGVILLANKTLSVVLTMYRVIQKGWCKSKANLFINELTYRNLHDMNDRRTHQV
jgi:hypothetical protein